MKKPLSPKAKGALIALALVALIGVCCVVVGFYAKSIITEGTYEIEKTYEKETLTAPESVYMRIEDILNSVDDTAATAVNLSTDISVDDGSIQTDLDEAALGVLKYMKSSIISSARESFDSADGKFRADGEAPRAAKLNSGKMTDCTVTVGRQEGEEFVDTDYRYFTITPALGNELPAAGTEEYEFLNLAAGEKAVAALREAYKDIVEISDASAVIKECTVNGKLARPFDILSEYNVSTVYTVSAKLGFKGELADKGSKSISFDCTVTERYSFKYAGLKFTEELVLIEQGNEEALPLEITMNDDAEEKDFSVKFVSSNPEVLEVSEDGVINGKKASAEPVEVRVHFVYLGYEYSEAVKVYVTVPVEKVLTSPAELTLRPGETAALTTAITPSEATMKDVLWFTEDESIATVNEAGTVTAVGGGTVKVFAVTVDGHFRSSCTVTVTNGEVK